MFYLLLAATLTAAPHAVLMTAKDLDSLPPAVVAAVGSKDAVDLKQSFRLTASGTPHDQALVLLAQPASGDRRHLRIVEVRQAGVAQTLDDHPGNQWLVYSLDAVAFEDVNLDGQLDLIVLVSSMSGNGPTGAEPFPAVGVWLGRADGTWTLDGPAGEQAQSDSMKVVLRKLRKHYRSTSARQKK